MRYSRNYDDQRGFDEKWYADLVYPLVIAGLIAFGWWLANQ